MSALSSVALVVEALLFGAALSLAPGPALLMLLDVSVRRGRVVGASFALGLATNDLVLATLAWLGMLELLATPTLRLVVGGIGALVLAALGVSMLRAVPTATAREDIASVGLAAHWARGALLNLVNPFVWVFWISAASAVAARPPTPGLGLLLCCVGGALGGDLAKVLLADALRSRLGARPQARLRRVSGLALIAFALHTLWATVQG